MANLEEYGAGTAVCAVSILLSNFPFLVILMYLVVCVWCFGFFIRIFSTKIDKDYNNNRLFLFIFYGQSGQNDKIILIF